MEDHELTIGAIEHYKNIACEMVNDNCNKCEAKHEYGNNHYCCFDNVIRFIEYISKNRI